MFASAMDCILRCAVSFVISKETAAAPRPPPPFVVCPHPRLIAWSEQGLNSVLCLLRQLVPGTSRCWVAQCMAQIGSIFFCHVKFQAWQILHPSFFGFSCYWINLTIPTNRHFLSLCAVTVLWRYGNLLICYSLVVWPKFLCFKFLVSTPWLINNLAGKSSSLDWDFAGLQYQSILCSAASNTAKTKVTFIPL